MVRELRDGPNTPHKAGEEAPSSGSGQVQGRGSDTSTALPFTSGNYDLVARVGLLAAAAYAFAAGLRVYNGAGVWDPAIALGLVLYLGALVSLTGAFTFREPRSPGVQRFFALLLLFALIASVAFEISVANRNYGTDSIAITHVAGELLLEGDNPYAVVGVPLAPLIDRFSFPEIFVTQTTSGDPIDRLVVYPGGQVLAYAGALAIGVDDLRWATLAFEVAALVVIWRALSPRARPLVPLVLLIEPNLTVYFTSGGVTDWVWVLPLLIAAVMLHRRAWGYAGLALGVACAVKQQPWFAVPFVLVWAYMEIRKAGDRDSTRRHVGSLVLGTIAGFAVLNLPFLIWGPGDWLRGAMSPILDHLVPDGQGFSLLASRGFLPVPQDVFTIAMITGFVVALFAYYRWFDRLKDLLWVWPAVLVILSHRSMHNYFIFWIPIAALWLDLETTSSSQAVLLDRQVRQRGPRRHLRPIAAVAAVVAISASVGAYLASARVIEVGQVNAEIDDGMVTALDVEVLNTGTDPVQPVFNVYWGAYPVPWEPTSATELGPGESALVRIVPTSGGVIPPMVVNGDGTAEPRSFRIRVNEMGRSTYSASSLVSLDPVRESMINSEFRYWGPSIGHADDSPFGWVSSKTVPTGTSVHTRTLGGGHGVAMTVRRQEAAVGGWVEAAVIQDVAAVASCYSVDLSYNSQYTASAGGRPLAATGMQVLQGDSAVWFVLSGVDQVEVTELPEGTRIVEIPASTGVEQTVMFDVADLGIDAGVNPGERGAIKLFSALDEHQPGPQEFRVDSITDCSEIS